jgi:gliding motility-associated-like protein
MKFVTKLLLCILSIAAFSSNIQAQTVTNFSYTGAVQTYTVPAGVTQLQVKLYGASGGDAIYGTATGGKGAFVQATINVTPGSTLNVYVGGQTGYNGGGAGGIGLFSVPATTKAGNGGGASDIRIGGTALANRVLVAGGGGGAGGAGTTNAGVLSGQGGNGGNSNAGGSAGANHDFGGSAPLGGITIGGQGGTVGVGGIAGTGCSIAAGTAGGNTGTGGVGAMVVNTVKATASPDGGGGGGGYVSGGGGGGGSAGTVGCTYNDNNAGGGGAGGSSFTGTATNVTITEGNNTGNGSIQITQLASITATGTLNAFATLAGTASASQSFTVAGALLTSNLIVTPPAGFEVSLVAGSGYGSTVSLSPVSGTVATTTIYVRLAAATSVGNYSGNIVCSSAGVTSVNVAIPSSTVSPSSYTAINNGNWSTAATWQGGVVPPAGADIIIAANVSIDVANVTVGNLTINTGFTLTGVYTNSITMNSGKTLTNNGTLTGTLGSLYTFIFSGSGLVAGSSATNFSTVQIYGAVDFGTTSSVANLTINAGGSVNTNRPTYTTGSSLNYNTGGTYIIGDEWVTGTTNYPRALTINAGTTLSFGSITTSRRVGGVNDAMNINGGLILSSAAGGDLIITSTYNNFNGTFTANGRTVTCLDGGSNCIVGGSQPVVFDNLVLNLPGKQFNLFTPVTVTTSATFTAGYTQLNATDLIFNSGATITGASANCYVYTTGTGSLVMKAVGAGPVVAPIGRNIGNVFIHYNPVTITNGGGFDYAIKANATAPTGTGILNTTKVIRCQWDITPSGNATNVGLKFQYITGQGVSGGTFSETGMQRGLHYNSGTSTWEAIGTSVASGTNPYTVSYTYSGPTWSPFSFETIIPPPTIITTGTLTAFTTCAGTASISQSFTTSGTNLTANLVVTPPTGYEVSLTSGSGYASSVILTPASGTVATTTIYVRLAATATGSPADNITVTSTGATTQNVAATGTVYPLLAAPTSVTATPSTIISGSSTNLNATSTGNIINWWTAATGGTLLNTTGSGVNYSVSPTVTTTYYAEAAPSPNILGTTVGSLLNNPSTWTVGYNFTPSSTITVTSVRRYFGSKISIWSSTGTLLMSQLCSGTDGVWTSTPCSPIVLNAGTTYRISVLSITNYYRQTVNTLPVTYPAGTITAGYEQLGDLFPAISDGQRWMIDLEFATTSCPSATRTPVTVTVGVPTITSFTPTSGPVGTTVTITGNYFNTTAANNIVYFGATKATVTSATATSMTVTVPAGATYGNITEINMGVSLLAHSNGNFTPTYTPNKNSIAATDFDPKIEIATGTGTTWPYQVALGDIDGDGKADLVVANRSSYNVSVFKNTSTSGTISFAAREDFSTAQEPRGLALVDLDGDGKLDIATTGGNLNQVAFTVLRNTSTSGSISFATKIEINTTAATYSIASADIDGDGKEDLIFGGPKMIIYPNTSTVGNITFAAPIDYTAAVNVNAIAIGDIDGDGLKDICFTAGNNVSVFRNLSTSGAINLATKVDFTAPSAYGIALGDWDGDGKLDIAASLLNTTNTLSIFTNTSTVGNISFATRIDNSSPQNPYFIAGGDLNGDGKADLVTTNAGQNGTAANLSVYRNTSTSGAASFASNIDLALGTWPYYAAIGDIDGDGRPDIVSSSVEANKVAIFRNNPQFQTVTTAGTLTAFTSCTGSVSVSQSFTAGGTALTANLVVTAPTGYEVSLTSGSGYASSVTLTPTSGTVASTTIYVRLAATASGTPSGNITVASTGATTKNVAVAGTVNTLPTATINAGGPTNFCAGGSVVLTASAGTSYLWSNSATTQSITVTTGGSYTVTVTNANNCSATSTATVVTVNTLPTATITAGGATTFCAGGSVVLTASAGSSYLWSNGATTQAITITTGGSYTVTVTNAFNCSAISAPTVVTVNALPTATITAGGATTFCTGGSVTLTASAGTSYLWSNGATTQAITVTAAGSYTVKVTNANGCFATSAATVVTVNTLPTATITAGSSTVFCAGSSVILTASAGSSYLWSNGATTQAITVTAAGSYTVTVINSSSCSASSAATVVTINPPSSASITAGGPTTFCSGNSVTLTTSPGASYLWSTGATSASINVTTPGSYTVTVTNVAGCVATSSATVITVNPLPIASISSASTTLCGTGATLSLTATGGSTYQWFNNGTSISGATAATYTASAIGTYTATATTALGCTAPATGSIVVTQLLAPIPAFIYDTYCTNKAINFTNQTTTTGSGAVSYTWSDNIGNTATTTNTNFTYASAANYSVKLKVQSSLCSNLKDSITKVIPVEVPLAAVRYNTVDAALNDNIQLQARSFGNKYTWSPSTGLTNIFISNPKANLSQQQEYKIAIGIPSGCTTIDTILVRVQEANTIYVPNVFTPNGDGRNDKVIIIPVGIRELKSFRIYNRWNKKVYETSDINAGWDGKVDGVLQPIETYVWTVEAYDKNGNLVVKTGAVTLLR